MRSDDKRGAEHITIREENSIMAILAKRTIKDRLAAGDNKYLVEQLADGRIKLTPAPDEVSEDGTAINANLLQPLEDARVEHAAAIADLQKLSPPAFYVTVTPATSGDTSVGTSDKTDAEIYAAYAAGRPVFCRVASEGYFYGYPATLPIFAAVKVGDNYMFAFCGSGAPRSGAGDAAVAVTVTRNQNNWYVYYDTLAKKTDIPTAIKNPNALTLKNGGTTVVYDGSTAKTFEVSGEEEEIVSATTTERVQSILLNVDSNGNAFSLKRWTLIISALPHPNTFNSPYYWAYASLALPGATETITMKSNKNGTAAVFKGDSESGAGWGTYPTTANDTTGTNRIYRPSATLKGVEISGGTDENAYLPQGMKVTIMGVRE